MLVVNNCNFANRFLVFWFAKVWAFPILFTYPFSYRHFDTFFFHIDYVFDNDTNRRPSSPQGTRPNNLHGSDRTNTAAQIVHVRVVVAPLAALLDEGFQRWILTAAHALTIFPIPHVPYSLFLWGDFNSFVHNYLF